MNSHLNKEIFSETGCINKDILLRYHQGKLRNADKHEVEKHLVDCNLCSDALEGFALITSPFAFDEVNERIRNITTEAPSINPTKIFAVAASIAIIISLTYFANRQLDDVKVERIAASEAIMSEDSLIPETVQEPVSQPPTQNDQQQIELSNQNNKSERAVKEEKPATIYQRQLSAEDVLAGTPEKNSEVVASIRANDVPAVAETQEAAADENEGIFSNSGAPASAGYISNITYVENRKVIDYSSLSKDEEKIETKKESSTPSKYQNQQKKAAAEKEAVQTGMEAKRSVSYLDLLSEPIALYNKGNYAAAVKQFDELIKLNPGDENARFYKGMSLYYLKDYASAISLLIPLSKINTQPFSEEALFYVAKSHVAKYENEKAISIFRNIVSKNGFYSEKAKSELKKLQ